MQNEIRVVLAALSQRPVAYHPVYAEITGSLVAGVLLSQLVYWWYAMGGNEFYKTDKDFCQELKIGLYELKAAKKKLLELKIISAVRRGVPAKTYYVLEEENLFTRITSCGKNQQLDSGKTHNKKREKPTTITENTAETTTETNPIPSGEAPQESLGNLINSLISDFKAVNPSYARFFSNKTQRGALERMLKQMDFLDLSAIIRFLPKTNGKQFAPVITSPLELESKLGALMAFCDKIKDKAASKFASKGKEIII